MDNSDTKPLAVIAADANHDGTVDAGDALLINQHAVGKQTINQEYTITLALPNDCSLIGDVSF